MIRKAYDLGINFFETADMYGKGKSEELLGKALADVRDEVIISTKYGYDFAGAKQVGHSELPQSFSAEFTRNALRASLERLGTDHVDVYGLHNPKIGHVRDDAIFTTLADLISANKTRACQVALGPAIGWMREGMEAMDRPEISAVQTVYNILEQTPGNDLSTRASALDVGILVRVPDASGILTGKVGADTKIDEKDHRSVRKGEWIRTSLDKVEQLRPIAESNGLRIDELAIKFLLSRGAVSSILPTVINTAEIESFASMSDGRMLQSSDLAEIERLYSSWPSYDLKSSAAA